MEETDAQLAQKEADLSDIAEEIAAMEEYERKLEEQKAKEAAEEQARIKAEEEAKKKAEEEAKKKAEEEAAKQEENTSTDGDDSEEETTVPDDSETGSSSSGAYYLHTTTPVTATAEEEELFAALIYCEAGGESYETQFAVASVVVNRINSASYPDNLVDVIYQKSQFSPASSGRLAVVLEKGLTTDSCRKAAKEALAGNICGDWLGFCYNFGTIDGTVIGSEVFF
jgi:spore germination cell wall hydrolase CwlJ-like protein